MQFVSSSATTSYQSADAGAASGDDSSGGGGESLLLLTASNDGSVSLWDLSRSAEAAGGRGLVPQCLAKATDLHNGEAAMSGLSHQSGSQLCGSLPA